MTLDEAIKHAKDKANEQRYYSQFEKVRNSCIKCAEEHEQLVSWLEELKELRKQKDKFDENIKFFNEINLKCHNQGYNKAIDDLSRKIAVYGTFDYYGNVVDILKIAEELKECAE